MTAMYGLIRHASSFLGLASSGQDTTDKAHQQQQLAKAEEGEIVYCKNNVCVHPAVPLGSDVEHRPGYLTIRMKHEEDCNPTLVLTWIPNVSLKKNPWSIENNKIESHSPCRSTRSSTCASPRRSPRHSLSSIHSRSSSPHLSWNGDYSVDEIQHSKTSPTIFAFPQNRSSNPLEAACISLMAPEPAQEASDASPSYGIGPEEVSEALEAMISGLDDVDTNAEDVTAQADENDDETATRLHSSPRRRELKLVLTRGSEEPNDGAGPPTATPNIAITGVALLDPSDRDCDQVFVAGPSSRPAAIVRNYSHYTDLSSYYIDSTPGPSSRPAAIVRNYSHYTDLSSYYIDSTPESLAAVRRLHFPEQNGANHSESPSPSRRVGQPCSLFSIDLIQMKSLRLFFSNRECTCGQLVIASRESQYKIFHFHHSGLNKLAQVLEKWDIFLQPKSKTDSCPYRQFSISRPHVSAAECHPEEGQYGVVDEDAWLSYMNEDGQVEEDFYLRKAIFFGGLDCSIRKEVWPFLLHYYPFVSTWNERNQIRNDRYLEYEAIRTKRETMSEAERESFWRNIQCTVEKDVVRTDRSNPFYVGDDNPNLAVMRNILLNYAVYNPNMGYTQGMSDLLAPILTEVQTEADVFWCFVGLMQRTIFISSPKDNDMDKHLNYIRELIRLVLPDFYAHLESQYDAMELLFCHRWILLCFKREFPESDALRMWESCWVNYQTDYFHLFLCLAIVAIYGEDVIEQGLNADEMLLHFSSLSSHMNDELVLRKARGLLHQFRQMPRIPCTLQGLCEMCGSGIWDSGHVPVVECVGHSGTDGGNGNSCPNGTDAPSL